MDGEGREYIGTSVLLGAFLTPSTSYLLTATYNYLQLGQINHNNRRSQLQLPLGLYRLSDNPTPPRILAEDGMQLYSLPYRPAVQHLASSWSGARCGEFPAQEVAQAQGEGIDDANLLQRMVMGTKPPPQSPLIPYFPIKGGGMLQNE